MKYIFTLVICALLSGCFGFGKKPEPEIKYVYKNVLIAPPDKLIKDCEIQEPPQAEAYLQSDWSDKEKLLMESFSRATEKAILCNVGIDGLRTWKKEQLKLYTPSEGSSGK